ncbi:vacuolar sorting protein [Trichodelitschia bisporula]|uniref:Vacuolar sorting protein n=1 Tax=Trichodelitschia bisporula TaxID=703511 RepID=A0A6G1HJ59_9PEZI|nr:vacuolar sorting protein [Trichodelitschia bisporula]
MSRLNPVLTPAHEKVLDEIDKLRHAGLSSVISLPQVIVVGDQSAGKSSVLEALSGIPFPRSEGLCTRFATEVSLRPATTSSASVAITPGESNLAPGERTRLQNWSAKIDGVEGLPGIIGQATTQMGLRPGCAFAEHVLRIEIAGPGQPRLTVVDLPGLIHSATKDQTEDDVKLISKLVQKYMENPRAIILAVVSAGNDFATQAILDRALKMDPKGRRTIGLITKPDKLDVGSENEAQFLELAKNENIIFKLGWHVLRNRSSKEMQVSTEERDRTEEDFFKQGVWKELPREHTGIAALRDRLGQLLAEHVDTQMPDLLGEIHNRLEACTTQLAKLGEGRETVREQRQFMAKASEALWKRCQEAERGIYHDPFFAAGDQTTWYPRRLQAVVQNLNAEFANTMRLRGHRRHIRPDDSAPPVETDAEIEMTRWEAVEWTRDILIHSRGRELPGSFNPLIMGDLFRDQSSLWPKLAEQHVDKVHDAVGTCMKALCGAIMDDHTAEGLLANWIQPRTEGRLRKGKAKLQELETRRLGDPGTYNHYYTETLQKMKSQREGKRLRKELAKLEADDSVFEVVEGCNWGSHKAPNLDRLAESLAAPTVLNMDEYAASELLDSMRAYYKVALKQFVDNVTEQVVKGLLIEALEEIFSPIAVTTMPKRLLTKITADSGRRSASGIMMDRSTASRATDRMEQI